MCVEGVRLGMKSLQGKTQKSNSCSGRETNEVGKMSNTGLCKSEGRRYTVTRTQFAYPEDAQANGYRFTISRIRKSKAAPVLA